MNKILFIVLLFPVFLTNFVFSTDHGIETKIFDMSQKSVVYIEQAVFLNSKDIVNADMFNKLETKYEVKILDTYQPFLSGSGVVISHDGYILTNQHVIDDAKSNLYKSELFNSMVYEFFSKVPSSEMTNAEFSGIKSDLKKMIFNSKIFFRVMINDKDFYPTHIINSDKELDIALLKIESKLNFTALRLGSSDEMKVGDFVLAIGYPLPSILSQIFVDFKHTMSTGVVSAIRNDNWGIQHTSAINPGNSGGALLNKNAEVIGINVGVLTDANSIFFSIPITKVKKWLDKNKFASLVKQNIVDSKILGSKYNLTQNGYLEVGESLLVKLPKGFKVYLDGKYKGETPLLLENLTYGKHTLKINSSTQYIQEKILVTKKIKTVFNYSPELKKYTASIYIDANVDNTDIFLDGTKRGVTPLVLNEISVGDHKLELQNEGYTSVTKTITLKRGKMKKINITLPKMYGLIFKGELPDEYSVEVSGESRNSTFKKGDKIFLQNGKYSISIKGDGFETLKSEIIVKSKNVELPIAITYYRSTIIFSNLKPDSRVFVNDKDVTNQIKNSKIVLTSKKYLVTVITPDYIDIKKEIALEKNKDFNLFLQYNKIPISRDKIFSVVTAFRVSGIISLALGGTMCIAAGISYSINYLRYGDSSYPYYISQWQTIQPVLFSIFGVGGGLALIGTTLLIISGAIEFHYNKIRKLESANLFFGYTNGLQLGISLRIK